MTRRTDGMEQKAAKRSLVTGASEGIGRAFAKRLAAEGYRVTAVARNAQRLAELEREIGPGHVSLTADLTTGDGVRRVCDEIRETRFELLVNNAGAGHIQPFAGAPIETWEAITRLNIDALVALSHAWLQTARSGDALINVSSVLAFFPSPGNVVYSATKAFVTSFTESLWYEERRTGVHVFNICPGLTQTEFAVRSGVGPPSPGPLLQSPGQVVDAAMAALRRRRCPTVLSGWRNGAIAFLSRLLPRKWRVFLVAQKSSRRAPPRRR